MAAQEAQAPSLNERTPIAGHCVLKVLGGGHTVHASVLQRE
jgi:hypothetical protein